MAIPLSKVHFLPRLQGLSILEVHRQLFQPDFDAFTPAERDQESDGPIEFRMDNGMTFHVQSVTESLSIRLDLGHMPKYGESYIMTEVGSNAFWFRRKERPIHHIDILISQYDRSNEFGIEIFLEGVDSFVIEYADEAPSFDQLRISGPYEGPQCQRVRVF